MLMKKMLWLIRLMEIMATKDNNNAGEDNDGDCNICGGGRDGVQVQLVSYVSVRIMIVSIIRLSSLLRYRLQI